MRDMNLINAVFDRCEDYTTANNIFILKMMIDKTRLTNVQSYIIKQIDYLHLIVVGEDPLQKETDLVRFSIVKESSPGLKIRIIISIEGEEYTQIEVMNYSDLQKALRLWGYTKEMKNGNVHRYN